MEEAEHNFSADVNVSGKPVTVLIVPRWEHTKEHSRCTFECIVDGVSLTTIAKNDDDSWEQLSGSLNDKAIEQIGDRIECHYL